ncbi:MAG: hypothetical protein JJU02_01080 [Cryomorphaceae bacterium]|nr:hypothetical protein [Cryomorphaceae bacterium]
MRLDISYPHKLIQNIETIPLRHAAPCSVLVGNMEIGTIFIACPSKDMKYFEIVPSSPPEPPRKFRMLDYKKEIFVLELWMLFSVKPEKYLKIHLNPHDKNVQRLLKLGSKTNMISFLFYDGGTQQLSTAITSLDDEEKAWFDRNSKMAASLTPNQRDYDTISKFQCNHIASTDRIFKYFNQSNRDFFVNEGEKLVQLHETSKLN